MTRVANITKFGVMPWLLVCVLVLYIFSYNKIKTDSEYMECTISKIVEVVVIIYNSFIHLVVCLKTVPNPLPKRAFNIVRSRASSFK
jgi:predicted membrane protein